MTKQDEENHYKAYAADYVSTGPVGQSYPREHLVRLLKGSYIPDMDRDFAGKRLLDIGFGNGMNLVLAGTLGFDLCGSEVDADIIDVARGVLADHDLQADLRVGENRAIPFPDEHVDFLISWDVLHYSSTRVEVVRALDEYARVMKPGGRFIMRTVGPTHWLPDQARLIDDETLEYLRGDLRDGWRVYRFGTEEALRSHLERKFSRVLIGRIQEDLFTEHWDLFLATGIKK